MYIHMNTSHMLSKQEREKGDGISIFLRKVNLEKKTNLMEISWLYSGSRVGSVKGEYLKPSKYY
jgi:hypothetical protein